MGSGEVRHLNRAGPIAAIGLAVLCLPALAYAQASSVLVRARSYAAEYERQFSFLVTEERYVQEVRRPGFVGRRGRIPSVGAGLDPQATPSVELTGGNTRRQLRSTYLVVAGTDGWLPFRDVFEVDGKPVHDRVDRLTRLFGEANASRFDLARQIMAESMRYNIGEVHRTINIPLLALLFLLPQHESQFAFVEEKRERLGGKAATVFRFEETGRPTVIRTGIPPADMPSNGRVWIETDTGRVLRTEHEASSGDVRAAVTVDFREERPFAFLVPDRMQEVYHIANTIGTVRGDARYAKYQRVQVSTDEKLALPKKPPPSGSLVQDPGRSHERPSFHGAISFNFGK